MEMHRPECQHAAKIAEGNRKEVHGPTEQVAALRERAEIPPDLLTGLKNAGYDGCIHCLRAEHVN